VAVSEPERLALHRAARAALGEQEGDTLMALSPPANTDMATMQALERTEERLDARITQLDAKIDTVAAKLDAKIDTVAAKLDARIDAVAVQLDAKIDASIESSALRTRLWTFGIVVAGQLASVTYLQGVLG
jgi:DNA repair ATPase RecN